MPNPIDRNKRIKRIKRSCRTIISGECIKRTPQTNVSNDLGCRKRISSWVQVMAICPLAIYTGNTSQYGFGIFNNQNHDFHWTNFWFSSSFFQIRSSCHQALHLWTLQCEVRNYRKFFPMPFEQWKDAALRPSVLDGWWKDWSKFKADLYLLTSSYWVRLSCSPSSEKLILWAWSTWSADHRPLSYRAENCSLLNLIKIISHLHRVSSRFSFDLFVFRPFSADSSVPIKAVRSQVKSAK